MGVQIPMGRGNFEGACPDMPNDTGVNCAKTAEPIEVPFGFWTRVGPRKHVLDGPQIPHVKGQLLGEKTCPACLTILCRELCKMAEPIDLPFGLWTQAG